LDGAGYGSDGAIWGGEVLISTYFNFKRAGQLEYLPMPGGDLCALYPFRMLISGLTTIFSDNEIRDITKYHIEKALPKGHTELEMILKQSRNLNVIKTSSSGRLLDSVASLLGLTYVRTYEGEPAMRLESLAELGDANRIKYEPEIKCNKSEYVLKTQNMLKYLIENKNIFKKEDMAAFVHKYLAIGISTIAIDVAKVEGINTISLSGGVFVNKSISREIIHNIEGQGLKAITNNKTPVGDGGTALGQSCIALTSVI
jgi:hydrogenase maturation protein HypF